MIEIKPLDNQVQKSSISIIPKIPFTSMVVGGKASGKSTLILNMLLSDKLFRNKFEEIYIFSPTATLDEKMNVLRRENILKKNLPLLRAIKRLTKQNNNIITPNYEIIGSDEIQTTLDDHNFVDELDLDFIEDIIDKQKATIAQFGKKIANNVLLVIDDLASETKTFMSSRFKKLVFLSRHYKLSMIITTQSYFQVPKAIRLNNSNLILYDTANDKELKNIYDENSTLTFNDFMRIYRQAVDEPFGFLTVNYQVPLKYRYANQFKFFIE